MTMPSLAGELAREIRTQGRLDAPQVRLGLQLAVAVWLDGGWDGPAGMRWGLFGTGVQQVLAQMFRSPPDQLVQVDPQGLCDEPDARTAVSDVVSAIADLLDTGSGAGSEHRWWAQQLRDALKDL